MIDTVMFTYEVKIKKTDRLSFVLAKKIFVNGRFVNRYATLNSKNKNPVSSSIKDAAVFLLNYNKKANIDNLKLHLLNFRGNSLKNCWWPLIKSGFKPIILSKFALSIVNNYNTLLKNEDKNDKLISFAKEINDLIIVENDNNLDFKIIKHPLNQK